jgi:hypothetical protein
VADEAVETGAFELDGRVLTPAKVELDLPQAHQIETGISVLTLQSSNF